MKRVDLSIITPFYKGYQYVDAINKRAQEIEEVFHHIGLETEYFIIDDTPAELRRRVKFNSEIIYLDNPSNLGIHSSRIRGLKAATGKFLLFLDQDDYVDGSRLLQAVQYATLGSIDVLVCNGYFENPNHENFRVPIYQTAGYKKATTRELNYVMGKDLIVSPGHCLVRRKAIPEEWQRIRIKTNGTDDYLLWLLLFNSNKSFCFLDMYFYTHIDTGENISFDISNWEASLNEMFSALSQLRYPTRKLRLLKVAGAVKTAYVDHKWGKMIKTSIRHPLVLLYSVFFRLHNGSTVLQAKDIS